MKPQGIIVIALVGLLLAAVLIVVGMTGDESKNLSNEEFIAQLRVSGNTGDVPGFVPGRAPTIDGQENMAAKIEVEANVYDLGLIASDTIAHGQLKVYNRGKVPLKISGIDTQCPCTMGFLPKEIEPGGEAIMEITVDPNLMQGFYSEKFLTIKSNDPVNRHFRVKVRASVSPEIAIEPNVLNFGIVEVGDTPERFIRIRQLADDDFTISYIESRGSEDKSFIVGHREVPEEDWAHPGKREYDVSVAVSPTASPGEHAIGLYVYTDSYKRLKSFGIRVEMTVQ